ncbi:MAG: phosphoadenosine phosphosulfate reductase family protein, partial [Gammaproteobacteria bacterium]|nr:phosphoadenosine phosphosulfate reductase family protein [Gammaproteobacteria bacterium]
MSGQRDSSGRTDPAGVHWLSALESEAIEIIREGAATAARPVMLYSMGKDSSVLLHLARKAFWPARPP